MGNGAKWIKVATDMFDDEKILIIESMPEADSIITIWTKLLCFAGKQANRGIFMLNGKIPYTLEMFATIFRRDVNTLTLAFTTFTELGMLVYEDGVYAIANWAKYQDMQKIERGKEYMRDYMREYRAKQRQSGIEVNENLNGKDSRKGLRKPEVKNTDIDIDIDNTTTTPYISISKEGGCGGGGETLESYATANLRFASQGNLEELITYRDSMDDGAIRYCIDIACAQGKPTYNYLRGILNRCVTRGLRTEADIRAADAEFQRKKTEPDKSPPTSEWTFY